MQEGLIGLCKAMHDFRTDKRRRSAPSRTVREPPDRHSDQTTTRYKHSPLNTYVSFSQTPAGPDPDSDVTLGDALPGSHVDDPSVAVISTDG